MIITVEDSRAVYEAKTNCGKVESVTRRTHGGDKATEVDFNDLPFLVQAAIEAKLNEAYDSVPTNFFKRINR